MSNLQTYYHFNLDFQKEDQHTGGKWLIHGTKRHKDNQLQSLVLFDISNWDILMIRYQSPLLVLRTECQDTAAADGLVPFIHQVISHGINEYIP